MGRVRGSDKTKSWRTFEENIRMKKKEQNRKKILRDLNWFRDSRRMYAIIESEREIARGRGKLAVDDCRRRKKTNHKVKKRKKCERQQKKEKEKLFWCFLLVFSICVPCLLLPRCGCAEWGENGNSKRRKFRGNEAEGGKRGAVKTKNRKCQRHGCLRRIASGRRSYKRKKSTH